MSKWFKFQLSKNRIVFINMDMIDVMEFTLTTVVVGEYELMGDDAERFRKEFEKYNREITGLVRVR